MAYRNNQNRNRGFGSGAGGSYGGNQLAPNRMGGGNMGMSPWDNQNVGNFGGGNMRQGGQGMNAQAINLANNLLNNLFRNQTPPSLLDLPRGGNGGMANRNQRGPMMGNRSGGGGGGGGGGSGPINRLNNRRGIQGGFQNRSGVGAKSAPKQGAGGIRKQNAFDRAKKLLAKNANNKKKDSASGEKKAESKESAYVNVPNDMFYCHLCKKHMWDANSFENHVKGRTHLMMREGIEESYRLKANMIRQEAKLTEQLKSIELDRLKRMGKSKQRLLEYCTMCDLNFHGHIAHHRKSEGHLQLKKFLHPECTECKKEFATRIDFDTHLLSADHLIKAAEKNTKVGERKRNTLNIQSHEDELKDLRLPLKRKKKVTGAQADGEVKKENDEVVEDGQEGSGSQADGEKKEGAAEGDADKTKDGEDLNDTAEEEGALPVDPENVILDYVDGEEIPPEIETRLPKYNWTRAVGNSQVKSLSCYECAVCGRFLDSEETAEVHTRTVTHYRNFIKLLNEKSSDSKIAQKRAAAAAEENERKKRKLEAAEAAKNEEIKEEGDEENGEGVDGDTAADVTDELYDPSEATGDDDVEMTENGDEDEEMEDDSAAAAAQENAAELVKEEPVVPEPEPEPMVVVKETPKLEATPVKAAAKVATPAAAATPPAANNANAATAPVTPAAEFPPNKKATPAAKTPAKTPARGRQRGRYNRY